MRGLDWRSGTIEPIQPVSRSSAGLRYRHYSGEPVIDDLEVNDVVEIADFDPAGSAQVRRAGFGCRGYALRSAINLVNELLCGRRATRLEPTQCFKVFL